MERNEKADVIAEKISMNLCDIHRGVLVLKSDELLAFGNDGYNTDERSKREVEEVSVWLSNKGYTVSGFGLNLDGDTWCILAAPPPRLRIVLQLHRLILEEVMWLAWIGQTRGPDSFAFRLYQQGGIDRVIDPSNLLGLNVAGQRKQRTRKGRKSA